MKVSRTGLLRISILAMVCIISMGCSTREVINQTSSDIEENKELLETECETQLIYLGKVIQQHSSSQRASKPGLVEANELMHMAQELFLRSEYSLALDLIEEALQVLEEGAD